MSRLPYPAAPPTPYCTDEDLCVTAPADFGPLVPRDQCAARASDGVILAPDPWTLSSPSTDFVVAGVNPGSVVIVSGPAPPFSPSGELFGVASVGPAGVTLKRRGADPGAGLPPGPASKVCFAVNTFMPQILRASLDLDRRYGVSDLWYGRRHCDLFDRTELRDAAVWSVLHAAYLGQSRGAFEPGIPAAGARGDVWGAKSRWAKSELDELLARVVVHWRPAVAPEGLTTPSGATTRFNARISR